VLENIEADQSYFVAEVANITKKTFDKQLARIGYALFLQLVMRTMAISFGQ
jgi:hypothetical protein